MGQSIVDIQNMGDAFRNTGYKNIESAVSEIVDNSVEANAEDILIILSEGIDSKSGRKIVTEIGFLDNGDGMNQTVLGSCLGIGCTTRAARKGMGRFGVGLPQASLYACPDVEVYSWQDGIENAKKVFLDINKVKQGEQTEIPDPVLEKLPKKYLSYKSWKTETKAFDFTKKGTLVIWKKCDRVTPKTSGPLSKRLEFALGQKFRYFINDGISQIHIICDQNKDQIRTVFPNDPLFLMAKNYVLGDSEHPEKAILRGNDSELEPFFEPYSANGIGSGEVEIPVKYYDKNHNIAESKVKVKFSIVKPSFYDETAFPSTNPGNGQFGKNYASKMEGISVIRANREIDFGKFDFYKNINEPQHRWWGCEIIFTPELDEAFGVANNKQYVDLKEIEEEDIDFDEAVQPIWLQLKEIISPTISAMYKKNEETRKSTRTFDTADTPSTHIINSVEEDEEDEEEIPAETEDIPEEEQIKVGQEELKNQGYENATSEQALAFLKNKVNFNYEDRGERGPAFDYKFVLQTTVITINTSHKFYSSFLSKFVDNKDAKTTFELFVASLVQSIKKTNTYQQSQNDKLVAMWYTKLNNYIEEQLNPKGN